MRNYEDLDQKIANHLSGNSTQKDEQDIKSWINESSKNKNHYLELKKFWQERSADIKLINHENKKWDIWRTYQDKKDHQSPTNRWNLTNVVFWSVAAVIILILVPTFLLKLNTTQNIESIELPVNRLLVKSNPPGQKSQFQLPDGSKVWLNAESTLSYNEYFSDSMRLLSLDGEAFFEVKRDTIRPFYVEMDGLRVRVLGTEFNVNAYKENPDIVVALVKGSVKLSIGNLDKEEVMLSPGYAISYLKGIDTHETIKLSDNPLFSKKYISWKEGVIAFDGQNFDEFIKEIKRWYAVDVTVKGTPPENWQIRASFENEYLNNILDAISFNKDFSYELNNESLKIIFN